MFGLSAHPHLFLLFTSLALGSVTLPVQAKYTEIFQPYPIDLPFTASQPVFTAELLPIPGKELVIVGMDDDQQRVLAIYAFDTQSNTFVMQDKINIGVNLFAYDVGEAQNDGLQRLYFFDKTQLYRYVPEHMSHPSKVIAEEAVSSMYLSDQAESFRQLDFIQDINDDGLDDVILPHFEQLNLWLSDCCGARHKQNLAIPARLEINDNSLSFDDQDIYYHDMNLDDKTDLIVVEQGKVNAYLQQANMQFSSEPISIAIDSSIYGVSWWDIKGPNDQERDQSDLQHRKVKAIDDFNGDGIADLAIEYTNSSGVLDKIIDYEFFYGKVNEGQLTFENSADTSVAIEKTLSDLKVLDTNMDGKMEVSVSSFDIGISQIVGALLSGSIDQEVLIFSMDEKGQFGEDPLVSQDVEITFSLSSGTRGQPLIKMVDVNGDKVKDIVYSDGDKVIRALLATPGQKRPYARRSLRQKLSMPKNASGAAAEDINGDEKADLVLNYGRGDDAELSKRVMVLMAK